MFFGFVAFVAAISALKSALQKKITHIRPLQDDS